MCARSHRNSSCSKELNGVLGLNKTKPRRAVCWEDWAGKLLEEFKRWEGLKRGTRRTTGRDITGWSHKRYKGTGGNRAKDVGTDRSSIYWLKMKRLWSRIQGKVWVIQGLAEPNNFHFIPTTRGRVEGYQLIWNQLIWWRCNVQMKDSGDILNSTTQTETQPYKHQLSEGGEIWPFREQCGLISPGSQTFKVNINFPWNQWEEPDGKVGHRYITVGHRPWAENLLLSCC